jgi:prepilin-type N-terminal cleavage/methylation domain-containing protein
MNLGRHPDRAGFTLLELLVALAVLTLLAAFLLPVFAAARDAARRSTCLSNLQQLAKAHLLYVQDYDEALPGWFFFGKASGNTYWPEFLQPYYHDAQFLDQGFVPSPERDASLWLADYALCAWGPSGKGTLANPYYRYPAMMPLCQVRRPAETLLFTDGLTTRLITQIGSRHWNGALNGALLDGHARRIAEADLERIDQDERGYFYHIAAADR